MGLVVCHDRLFWDGAVAADMKAGAACRDAEQRFGLRRAASRDRTAARRPTRPESEEARRRGLHEAPRITLRRAVSTAAAGAVSEQEFFTRLDLAGVLVRKRFSTRNPGEVTGYAVALPHDTTRAGAPVWFGGGKLAADLTLPKLRSRWQATGPRPGDRFTAAERSVIWEHAARTAAGAAEQIRNVAAADPEAAADAAWAAADTLHAAAAALGSRVLRQAADSYDRAARAPYGRIPAPGQPGNNLRRAARLLSTVTSVVADAPLAGTERVQWRFVPGRADEAAEPRKSLAGRTLSRPRRGSPCGPHELPAPCSAPSWATPPPPGRRSSRTTRPCARVTGAAGPAGDSSSAPSEPGPPRWRPSYWPNGPPCSPAATRTSP